MNSTAKLYIIRHAEADGNIYRRCHGQYDGLITENGKAQIERLRERFAGTIFDAVYSSDLYRAKKTAAALETNHREALSELREINLGIWEDRTWQEFRALDHEQYNLFMRTWDFNIEGGECPADVQRRMYDMVCRLIERHRGQTIAVVSHGVAIRLLLMKLYGYPLSQPDKLKLGDNTAVAYVEWNDKPTVIFCGDNTHLGELSTIEKQSWWKKHPVKHDVEFWFRPAVLPQDRDKCVEFRRKAWLAVHGTERGYNEALVRDEFEAVLGAHPRAAQFVMRGDDAVGIIQLKTMLGVEENAGHISLLYIDEELRGQGLGVQLIGEAVSVYRSLGRERLRLYVSRDNSRAVRFYQKHGFERRGETTGEMGVSWVMYKSIVPDL